MDSLKDLLLNLAKIAKLKLLNPTGFFKSQPNFKSHSKTFNKDDTLMKTNGKW
jgi:hypothetical protein